MLGCINKTGTGGDNCQVDYYGMDHSLKQPPPLLERLFDRCVFVCLCVCLRMCVCVFFACLCVCLARVNVCTGVYVCVCVCVCYL